MKLRLVFGFALLCLLPICVLATIKPNLPPYKVDPDLKNVVNLEEFKDAVNHYSRGGFTLNDAQQKALVGNGFVVMPSDAEQFFQVYESEHYGMRPRIANFITADCALQMYHLLYDFTLKQVELEALYPALKDLTLGMLKGSIEQSQDTSRVDLQSAALRNVSFFAVPARLLKLEMPELPPACVAVVDSELARIARHDTRDTCRPILSGMDYTQFVTRGHYTRTPEMEAYFLAMMWYGLASFPLDSVSSEQGISCQPLLMNELLFDVSEADAPLITLWDKIYSITALYVGVSNNVDPHQLRNATAGWSRGQETEDYCADWHRLKWAIQNLPGPGIEQIALGLNTGKQFRFMSQRYMPDSYALQRLSHPDYRPWPKGLDVMAVLGSGRAAEILDNVYKEPANWDAYPSRRDSLAQRFAAFDSEWDESLVAGWLHMLQALIEERGEGYPSFMRNSAWTDKQLNTSLASWSEMRRDVILYATPSYAEGGDGEDEQRAPRGYVEPVVDFYSLLLKQVQENRRLLMAAGYLNEDMSDVFARYEKLIAFFRKVSIKELTGETVTEAEYEAIRTFGLTIEDLSLDILKLDRAIPVHDERTGDAEPGRKVEVRDIELQSWFQVTGPDRDVACIADVHNHLVHCLEEAVGHIDQIYVVVPINGKLHLTRGGVFSYYEFTYPAAHRLNDEAWQEMIKRGRAPERPVWTSSFLVP